MSESGVTTFVTTQYMDEAEYCDRLALIYKGKIIAIGSPTELKLNTLKKGVMELQCDPIIVAYEMLKQESWIDEVAVFGNTLHLVFKEDLESEDKGRDVLANKDILIERMDWIILSLEDVFLSRIKSVEGR